MNFLKLLSLVLPEWLTICRTTLLPKSEQTSEAKNYRPIACQNVTNKIFTGILNTFITDHVVVTILSLRNKQVVNQEAGDVQTNY